MNRTNSPTSKTIRIAISLFISTAGVFLISCGAPADETFIQNFRENRTAYERLRNLIEEDNINRKIITVAEWGVDTKESSHRPPDGDFPLARYNEYLLLLKRVGGVSVSAEREKLNSKFCVLVWVRGIAPNTEHVAICRIEDISMSTDINSSDSKVPTRCAEDPGSCWSDSSYTHIDRNWYLQKD